MIGGSGRGAGKTAVGCALIAAIPELRWLAVKISPHLHELEDGVLEETDRNSEKDTGRYLRAGARRSCLVAASSVSSEFLDRLLNRLGRVPEADGVLIESGGIESSVVAGTGGCSVRLAALAGAVAEWKSSLWEGADYADALVLTGGLSVSDLPDEFVARAVFTLPAEAWSTPELVGFVRKRLLPVS